jgi:hypothetical protein
VWIGLYGLKELLNLYYYVTHYFVLRTHMNEYAGALDQLERIDMEKQDSTETTEEIDQSEELESLQQEIRVRIL